jgi:hypothetical protein
MNHDECATSRAARIWFCVARLAITYYAAPNADGAMAKKIGNILGCHLIAPVYDGLQIQVCIEQFGIVLLKQIDFLLIFEQRIDLMHFHN